MVAYDSESLKPGGCFDCTIIYLFFVTDYLIGQFTLPWPRLWRRSNRTTQVQVFGVPRLHQNCVQVTFHHQNDYTWMNIKRILHQYRLL